jgi:class 3 adenylate cyclase
VIIFATMALVGRAVETRERNDFVLQQRLEQTKQRNDAILDNMLPRHVNEQRKRGAAVIANLEPSVSVLFCDVQDFKQIVKENSPAELIRLLDSLYSAMDVVSDELQVTKMETVGYTYMACAGLQGAPASAKGHAYDAIRMAFELLRIANDARGANGRRIVVRIGINSGQVLSGVVGDSKPQYCLFGDTVNTAARMQAKGERMEVHISSRTREELAQAGVDDEFDFVQRTVVAKGLGELTTFLVRKKGDPGASALLALADEADEASQLGALVGPAQPPKDAPPARNGRRQLSITLGSERKPFGRFLKSDATGGAETSPPMRRARATTSAFVRTGAHAAQACGWAEPSAADSPPAVAPDCPQPQPAQQPAQVPRLDLKGKFFRRKTGESSASDLGAGPATPGAASSGQQTPRVLTIMPEEQRRREDNEIASTMRRWDLRFLGDDELLEAVFERSHALYSLREMRVVLFIFAIGQVRAGKRERGRETTAGGAPSLRSSNPSRRSPEKASDTCRRTPHPLPHPAITASASPALAACCPRWALWSSRV